MKRAVSAADANRYFSKLLREAKAGRASVITSHGRAVARLVPAETGDQSRAAGKATLLKRLRSQKTATAPLNWTRDELYEDVE